ncbi:MAG: hypothetical protein PHV17_10240, partial [Candidatus Omnitrophica bacterium]|nr:hypothetical protein [Candidatus Omnitrophota bacterium]
MKRGKPYLKRFSETSGFKVWIVDGEYIRSKIDREFTNYGQHYRFNFIPEKEFWIDKQKVPGEEKFYIINMLVENRLMAKGLRYSEAVDKANSVERKERIKDYLIRKGIETRRKIKESAESVHKRLLKKYSKKLKVWIVDGRLVRDLFFIDFTEGGHDKVYPFIPAGEIWLDDDLTLREIKFVLLHEVHERNLMCSGENYDTAHEASSEIEYF